VISQSLFLPVILPVLLFIAVGLVAIGGFGYWRMAVIPSETAQATPEKVIAATTTAIVTITTAAVDTAEHVKQTDEVMAATTSWLAQDQDRDGLTNGQEEGLGTQFDQLDTDKDGLNDGDEVNIWGTDPLQADTDGDGLEDGEEVRRGINPLEADTDGTPDTTNNDPDQGPTATPTNTRPPTDTPTATPTRAQPGLTATPTRAPIITPTKAATIASKPTLIPLKTQETVDQIGRREVIDVDINPKNPKEVYTLVKGNGLYKSSNGGDGPWAKMDLDASSVTALVIDPTNPARLYAPTWNAVLRSDDGGNTWQAFGNGLSTANRVVDVVTIDPVNPNLLYAGIGTTLVVSTDGGENWTSLGYGNGLMRGKLTQIVVDPFDQDTIYVGGLFSSIYKSTDSGHNFTQLAFNAGKGTFGLAAHPTQKNVYLAGINAYEAGIIKTENGSDFRPASDGLIFGGADSAYSAIIYAPGNPDIVYAGSGYQDDRFAKGIFKSIDGGDNWRRISDGLGINLATGHPHYVKFIAVHPTNPDIVLAATGSGLYKSVDGGTSWSSR
jgi:photosystem II stability/assembly factor-like uncharacterized protein